jgi:hypothetical protein
MSFIQNNLLTNDTFQSTLSSFFVSHFGEVKSMMKNILLNINNNSVSISYLENNIRPLFNSADISFIPKIYNNVIWLTEQFPLFLSTMNNGFEDLKSVLESQHFLLPLTNSMNNLTNEIHLMFEANFSKFESSALEIAASLNTQQTLFLHQFSLISEMVDQINPDILSTIIPLINNIPNIPMFEKTNKELNSSILFLQNQFKNFPKLKIFTTTLNLLNIIKNDTSNLPNVLLNIFQDKLARVTTIDNFSSMETMFLSHLNNKFDAISSP